MALIYLAHSSEITYPSLVVLLPHPKPSVHFNFHSQSFIWSSMSKFEEFFNDNSSFALEMSSMFFSRSVFSENPEK